MPNTYDYLKHREEVKAYAHDFAPDLVTGETLSSVDSTQVQELQGGTWTDVSSEFGSPTGTIDGTTVEFTLGAAGAGDQDEGDYRVRIAVTTSEGQTLVGLVDVPGPYPDVLRLRVVD